MKKLAGLGVAALILVGCCCRRPCEVVGSVPGAVAVEPPPPVEGVEPAGADLLMNALISKRVKGLQWEDVSFDTMLVYLRTITGTSFFITAKAREKVEDATITLALHDVAVATVLDVVTRTHELRWKTEDGLVKIYRADEERPDGTLLLRYFDARDLAPAVAVDLPREDGVPPRDDPSRANGDIERLIDRIREQIDPGSWDDGTRALEVRNGILIARAPAPVLDAIARMLDEMRAAAAARVLVVQIHSVADLVAGEATSAEALCESIEASVRPEVWSGEKTVVRAQGENALVVRATAEVQDAVAAYLTTLREKAAPEEDR